MRFQIQAESERIGARQGVLLRPSDWDDYNFVTLFRAVFIDDQDLEHDIGAVKIGRAGTPKKTPMTAVLPSEFETLDDTFFSLGTDESYYANLSVIGDDFRDEFLNNMRDVAADPERFERYFNEPVMQDSLLRDVAPLTVTRQFRRIAQGGVRLDNFAFEYLTLGDTTPVRFDVAAESLPPSNIHVLIGRNGVGKSHTLRNMAFAFRSGMVEFGEFRDLAQEGSQTFANMVSVAFSPFENHRPPANMPESSDRPCSFVGLGRAIPGNPAAQTAVSSTDLRQQFAAALSDCARYPDRRRRWLEAIDTLRSDPVFESLDLPALLDKATEQKAAATFADLSSGHKIVLLAITELVNLVAERTLVLIDEPEAHLHPPLLAALIRALSDLMTKRNGVAIVASHSPVVLQEVPRSCVWVLRRAGAMTRADRPKVETFGENVGVLTREIFGLEVTQSGFHRLVAERASNAESYETLLEEFGHQLGSEGKAIALGLIAQAQDDA